MKKRSNNFYNALAHVESMSVVDELRQLMGVATRRLALLEWAQAQKPPPSSLFDINQESEAADDKNEASGNGLKLQQVALIACMDHVDESGEGNFIAADITPRMAKMGRCPTNISTTLDPLVEAGFLAYAVESAPGKHRIYLLTETGRQEATRLKQLARDVQ